MTDALPEEERNTLLRRADWRFLVPLADEPRTLAAGDDALARAARAVFPAAGGAPALAVLDRPTPAALAEAAPQLVPGGYVYAEWPRARRRPVRRRLETAGLHDVRCWARWPARGAPQLWLPLDAPAATAAFLATRGGGLRARALRRAWQLAVRLGAPVPLSAIGRTAGGEDAEPETARVLLTGGRKSINKVVGLVLAPRGPEVAVKFARDAADEPPLRREAEVLRAVEAARPNLPGVPRVTFVGRRCGRLAVGETFVGGMPLGNRLGPATLRGLSLSVTEWLVRLAGDTAPAARDDWWERLVAGPLATLGRQFAGVVEPGELETAAAVLATLPALPLVVEHRDCSPWNALVDEAGEVALVDWESADAAGLPGLDLVYFLTYAALFHDGAPELPGALEAYERSLDPASPTGRVVAECETLYCERLGLERSDLVPLRLLCWIVHCRSDFRHAELEAAGAPAPERLACGLFLSLLRAELRRAGASAPAA